MRQTRTDTERSIVLFWLAPAGIRRFTVSCLLTLSGLLAWKPCFSPCGLSRIITENRPCRFCAIAVTLATRTCVRLRDRWVGGLSSATLKSPSAALSLSCIDGKGNEISPAPAMGRLVRFDRLLTMVRHSQSQRKGMDMQLLTAEEGILAVRLARGTIESACAKKPGPSLSLTPVFREKRGVFVTISKEGQLRGCIGLPYPVMPLGEALEHAAKAAALEDPRFPPVKKDELAIISVEVTILTIPEAINGSPSDRVRHIEIGKHGLIIRGMGTSGLLLPQVATEYGWDAETFLDHSCQKAGLPARCWTYPNIEVLTFEGQIFSEK